MFRASLFRIGCLRRRLPICRLGLLWFLLLPATLLIASVRIFVSYGMGVAWGFGVVVSIVLGCGCFTGVGGVVSGIVF